MGKNEVFQIIAKRFGESLACANRGDNLSNEYTVSVTDEADVKKRGNVPASKVTQLVANICGDFGTEVHLPGGETPEDLVRKTGADSLLFMDFIKLLDQPSLRSVLPEQARGEVITTLRQRLTLITVISLSMALLRSTNVPWS